MLNDFELEYHKEDLNYRRERLQKINIDIKTVTAIFIHIQS